MSDEPQLQLERSRKEGRERRTWTTIYFVGAILVALALIAVIAMLYG
jgi:hypothetical protein